MGQAGMPDAFRITVEGFEARPQKEARSHASIVRKSDPKTPLRTRYGGIRAALAVAAPRRPNRESPQEAGQSRRRTRRTLARRDDRDEMPLDGPTNEFRRR